MMMFYPYLYIICAQTAAAAGTYVINYGHDEMLHADDDGMRYTVHNSCKEQKKQYNKSRNWQTICAVHIETD